jgi:tRNA dimethylallyltransferase
MDMPAPVTVHIVAGPTASGKSARALQIARARNGVIINADSMQIYDALPLLTARPDAGEQAQAPHRLYAFLNPAAHFSAAGWAQAALREIAQAHGNGQAPVVVGGTGLYLRALMEGFSPIPDIPADIRAATMARQAECGNPAFHALLAARDPVMAARLHPHDTQRLIRAYEVFEATGRSLAAWQGVAPVPPRLPDGAALTFAVTLFDLPRTVMHERCDRRFAQMLERGALDEVADLAARIDAGLVPEAALVTKALGFAALRDHLRGQIPLAEAAARTRAQTRQYVKRQCTWLRHQLPGRDAPHPGISAFTVVETLEN